MCLSLKAGTYYVVVKSGLNLREKPDTNSKVLIRLPYGATVTATDSIKIQFKRDNVFNFWVKVTYKGLVGYVANRYLINQPAPLASCNGLRDYFAQLSKITYTSKSFREIRHSHESCMLTKTIFENGMEEHNVSCEDDGETDYFLPQWEKYEVFMVLRCLKEFEYIFEVCDGVPQIGKSYRKGDKTLEIKNIDGAISIKYRWDEGAEILITSSCSQVIVHVQHGIY